MCVWSFMFERGLSFEGGSYRCSVHRSYMVTCRVVVVDELNGVKYFISNANTNYRQNKLIHTTYYRLDQTRLE